MTAPGDDGADGPGDSEPQGDQRGDSPERHRAPDRGRDTTRNPRGRDHRARRQPESDDTAPDEPRPGGDSTGTRPATERDADAPARSEWRSEAETPEPTVEYPDQETGGDGWELFVRDVVSSVLAVALVGFYLFAISGVWPPMVAIESPSMDPHMQVNDLVFVMDEARFQPSAAHEETGIVTAQTGETAGYKQYGNSGDVIVFAPDGNDNVTPIIHRAMFWVEAGENWCEQANPDYLGALDPSDNRCTADNDGFITKGDNNAMYDQAAGSQVSRPVKPEWIVGTAEVRIPRLGWFRLQFQ